MDLPAGNGRSSGNAWRSRRRRNDPLQRGHPAAGDARRTTRPSTGRPRSRARPPSVGASETLEREQIPDDGLARLGSEPLGRCAGPGLVAADCRMHRVLLTLGVRRARNERLCCAGPKEQLKRSARPRRLQRPTGRPYNIPYLCDLSHCVPAGKVATIPSAIRRIERTVASLARATLDDLADNDQKRDTEREPPQRANHQLTARRPCSPPSPVPARLVYRHVSRIISLPQFRNAAVGAFYRFFAPEEQARTPQPSGRPSEMGDRRR